ncbi:MAG: glutamate 5-kinase [Nitrospirae bacterium]|nr:glutamate 5-kinase [Nitrospirota bacterium]
MKLSDERVDLLHNVRRIVIKIGSRVLASSARGINALRIKRIIKEIALLRQEGYEVVIVSSGAIAAGMKELGLSNKPKGIPLKQAAAAIGQSKLIQMYERNFSRFGIKAAQILLTRDDITDRRRFLNARNTLITLLSYGIVPVINENDTVAIDEIKFGDNDLLSGLVTNVVDADILIILSDIEGLFTADPSIHPDARLVPLVRDINKDIENFAGDSRTIEGTGGMASKVQAAKKAAGYGIPAIIMSGSKPGLLVNALRGSDVGTIFLPRKSRLTSRKHWIAYALHTSGYLVLDNGAKDALLLRGKSLLPSGVLDIKGHFEAGDAVTCEDGEGKAFAKGLTNYSSREIEKIKGRKTGDIAAILGYKDYDEVIHRDNLVIL